MEGAGENEMIGARLFRSALGGSFLPPDRNAGECAECVVDRSRVGEDAGDIRIESHYNYPIRQPRRVGVPTRPAEIVFGEHVVFGDPWRSRRHRPTAALLRILDAHDALPAGR